MNLISLKVRNYRALKEISIPLSNFGCLIGENNSGKSSVLQAVILFHSGSSLPSSHYYDTSLPIRIEITFSDITDEDINRLDESHRERTRNIIKDGCLTLVRIYGMDGRSTLNYVGRVPREERFSEDKIDALVKGKKAGTMFMKEALDIFPEINGKIDTKSTQKQVKDAIRSVINSLPDEQLRVADCPLPTGLDKSISALLPEPIYIPAAKDLGDEVKTKESTSFGRILRILLDQIEGELQGADNLFTQLNQKLNPIELEDGTFDDTNRLQQIKNIETTVERFVQESFRDVKLRIRIPPPEIKTVLSNAQIFADDGIEGLIDTKGDGLRRAVVFSILRAYVELRRQHENAGEKQQHGNNRYLLLFEEPELFLHPQAQLILFDALREFSMRHAVLVTTHSPSFFSPDATTTFIKLYKEVAEKSSSCALAIDLSDMKTKDQFQIICYENNNAAFFSNTVVLVEGDSDLIVLPHIAKTLNSNWDTMQLPVCFAKINGKSSIGRYQQFFQRFRVRTVVIADLDLIINDFEKVAPNSELTEMRNDLLARVDKIVKDNKESDLSGGQVQELQKSGRAKGLCKEMLNALKAARADQGSIEKAEEASEAFFNFVRKDDRLSVLKNEVDSEFVQQKRLLLARLRESEVYILERGAIEAYYPEEIQGHDKPSKAQFFCNTVMTKDALLELCSEHDGFEHNGCSKEFSLILGPIFEPN